MKGKSLLVFFALVLLTSELTSFTQEVARGPSKYTLGVVTGYNMGYGLQGNVTLHNFLISFPFEIRFGMGYGVLNPGSQWDARRIFINNNTNGTPEKNGKSFDFRMDFLVPRTIFSIENSFLIVGPRYSTFNGDFKFVGGNEDFEVKSKQWGIGAGIENQFRMYKNINLVFVYGLDYYFPSTLTGHDTSYSPDNDNVNVRNDNQNDNIPFTYQDADKAIKQPRFMPRAMIGLSFDL
jgi:hypothetical protein